MKQRTRSFRISGLAPWLLFAVFAACVVMVLLFGAESYRGLSHRDRQSYQQRTAVQYLTTRIRQSDADGLVFVGDFDTAQPNAAGDTLFICEMLNGRTYYTRVYCHEGYLCELFAEASEAFEPGDGQRVLQAEGLQITQQGQVLTMKLTFADGETAVFRVTCRAGKDGL